MVVWYGIDSTLSLCNTAKGELVSLVFSARKKFLVLGIYVLHVWLK